MHDNVIIYNTSMEDSYCFSTGGSQIASFHRCIWFSCFFWAIFKTHWFSGTLSDCLKNVQITLKELFPIVLTLEMSGSLLRNQCLILHSDNEAVVHIINKQTSKYKYSMYLVRRLILI